MVFTLTINNFSEGACRRHFCSGYLIFHPFSNRLKRKSLEEIKNMNIILEGVLAIQAGNNPKSIERKLVGMLEPKDRIKLEKNSNN